MKNIFAYNLDNLDDEICPDGEVFITDRIDDSKKEIIDENLKRLAEAEKKYSMPILLKVVRYIAYLLFIIFARVILEFIFESSFRIVYSNMPFMFYAGVISSVVALLLYILEKKKKKDFESSEELKTVNEEAALIENNAIRDFGIPKDARKIDVLTYRYKEKDGKEKIKPIKYAKYKNIKKFVYIKDEFLCFADIHSVVSIPLDSLKDLEIIKRRTSISQWNKVESFKSKEYKTFKVVPNQYGFFTIKYYALNINYAKEEYQIFIPNYDVKELISLIGFGEEENEEGENENENEIE